jgi:hypothetical protein
MTTPTATPAKAREIAEKLYEYGLRYEHRRYFEQIILSYGDERAREAREAALEIIGTFNVADAGFSAQEMLAALGERIRALKGKS